MRNAAKHARMAEQDRFAEVLRPRVMGPRLSAVLGGRPGPCHVLDAKYEPGSRAVVLYEHGGALVRGDLTADVGPDIPVARTGCQDGPLIVSPGLRLSVFPDDPDLPWLSRAIDPATLASLLRTAGAVATPPQAGPIQCRVRLLRYRPGKRATLLVETWPGRKAYVAKVYHDPGKAAAVATEARALASLRLPGRVLRFAEPILHAPELALLVQGAVGGTTLDQFLNTAHGCAAAGWPGVRLAAWALAELHALPVSSHRPRPVELELRRFGARARAAATVDVRLGTVLADLADRLVQLRARLPRERPGMVHGDCKPSQFMLAGDHVVLLDLDHCGVADPVGDLGTFLATLRQRAVRHWLAGADPRFAGQLVALGEEFLAAYLERVELPPGDDVLVRVAVRWYEAVALERKALRAFARAPRSRLPEALVAEAHRLLDRQERFENIDSLQGAAR